MMDNSTRQPPTFLENDAAVLVFDLQNERNVDGH